jgi:hypothetical protein
MALRTRSLTAALVLAMAVPTLSAAAQRRAFVTIPAGTTLNVRLAETIPDIEFNRPRATYRGFLDRSVTIHRAIVIPRGATVLLRASDVPGRSDRIALRARDVSFGGRTYRLKTSYVQARGRRAGTGPTRTGIRGAALGTVVGGVAGGGTGAAIGATVGGTTGVVAGNRVGQLRRVPANTRLRFRLNSAVTVRG